MITDQFKIVGMNHVESVRGFSVQRDDKNTLLYSEKDFVTKIEVEPGNPMAVYLTYSAKQYGKNDKEIEAIKRNLTDALRFMNVQFNII